ncbi:MAG: hypothetical protein KCHDKBKB_00661 [Elusimicrobia bacterium]|nr:hypothetical protein [Elusimicrobiota bacterium]
MVRERLGKPESIYNKMFEKIPLMLAYRGSHAHNLYVPPEEKWGTDDIDTISVFAYPKQYYYTLEGYAHAKETYEVKQDAIDEVGYELHKMFVLLSGMNPNVINTLYMRKEDYINISPVWQYVIDNRHLFVSKNLVYNCFGGYARAQLKRMNESNPYRGYMGEKRKKMVDLIGYDSKNASHLVRLLKMGIEFLRDGAPIVYRTEDRQELIDIKLGEYSLDQVKALAEQLFQKFEYEYQISTIPDTNNRIKINKLLYEVMEMIHADSSTA